MKILKISGCYDPPGHSKACSVCLKSKRPVFDEDIATGERRLAHVEVSELSLHFYTICRLNGLAPPKRVDIDRYWNYTLEWVVPDNFFDLWELYREEEGVEVEEIDELEEDELEEEEEDETDEDKSERVL